MCVCMDWRSIQGVSLPHAQYSMTLARIKWVLKMNDFFNLAKQASHAVYPATSFLKDLECHIVFVMFL